MPAIPPFWADGMHTAIQATMRLMLAASLIESTFTVVEYDL
jgi:hypothetical protein